MTSRAAPEWSGPRRIHGRLAGYTDAAHAEQLLTWLSADAASTLAVPLEGLWRRAALAIHPLPGGRSLVAPRPAGPAHVLRTSTLERVLDGCPGFATLEAHAAAVIETLGLPADRREPMRALLDDLRQRGLLISARETIEALLAGRPVDEDAPAPIRTVAFPTGRRPAVLLEGVRGVLAAARRRGRELTLLVADDSADPGERLAHREGLRATGARVGYVGLEERERFATALAERAGVRPQLVRFALLDVHGVGKPYGANRNALLLATAGEAFLSMDDDVRWRASGASAAELALSSGVDPTQTELFTDRAAVLAACPEVDVDVMRLHEEELGRSVRVRLAEALQRHRVDLDRLEPETALRLAARGGRVLVTHMGVHGDPGMDLTGVLLAPPRSLRATLRRSPELFGAYRAGCEVDRRAPCVTLARAGVTFWTSGAIGLDNRRLLPPFLPTGRLEDMIFSATLERCFADAWIGFLPWSLLHDRPTRTRFAGDGLRGPGLGTIILSWLRRLELGHGTPQELLARAGRWFRSLGGLAPRELADALAVEVLAATGATMGVLETQLSAPGQGSSVHAEAVREKLRAIEAAVTSRRSAVPADILAGRTEEQALAAVGEQLRGFGELLEAWPELHRAAQALREEGRGLAVAP